jgi:ABC-type amino acid transport system permease subunit
MTFGLPSTVVLTPPMFSSRSNVQTICEGFCANAIAGNHMTNSASAAAVFLKIIVGLLCAGSLTSHVQVVQLFGFGRVTSLLYRRTPMHILIHRLTTVLRRPG